MGTFDLPAEWEPLFGRITGLVRLTRRFGRPTNCDTDERIWLEITSPAAEILLSLNGEWLATWVAGTARFDVTQRLAERNRIDLDLTCEDPPGGEAAPPDVALVIESLDS